MARRIWWSSSSSGAMPSASRTATPLCGSRSTDTAPSPIRHCRSATIASTCSASLRRSLTIHGRWPVLRTYTTRRTTACLTCSGCQVTTWVGFSPVSAVASSRRTSSPASRRVRAEPGTPTHCSTAASRPRGNSWPSPRRRSSAERCSSCSTNSGTPTTTSFTRSSVPAGATRRRRSSSPAARVAGRVSSRSLCSASSHAKAGRCCTRPALAPSPRPCARWPESARRRCRRCSPTSTRSWPQ